MLLTLGYVTYITMWSLFRIRLVGTMELVPHRTHPKSLSFNVRMIARLVSSCIEILWRHKFMCVCMYGMYVCMCVSADNPSGILLSGLDGRARSEAGRLGIQPRP